MTKPFKYALVAAISCLSPCVCYAQAGEALQAAGTLLRGKSAIEFYEAAIADPSQVLFLSVQIQQLFPNSGSRYKGLSNKLAEQVGWFSKGPLALRHIVVSPEPSPSYKYGYFSITLKNLKYKQCEALASNAALNGNFLRVDVNGVSVSVNGSQQSQKTQCKSQLPFQDGKNVVKYINN